MKKVLLNIYGVAALCATLSITMSVFFGMILGAQYVYEFFGIQCGTWYCMLIHVFLMFTVMLDITVWCELNTIALFNKYHAFDAWNTYGVIRFYKRPFSCIMAAINN